jgi:hypothetical protein
MSWYIRAQEEGKETTFTYAKRLDRPLSFAFHTDMMTPFHPMGDGHGGVGDLEKHKKMASAYNGRIFETMFTAEYVPHGVYDIKVYRPTEIPQWLWEYVHKAVKAIAEKVAFETLDKVREELDPYHMIAKTIMGE